MFGGSGSHVLWYCNFWEITFFWIFLFNDLSTCLIQTSSSAIELSYQLIKIGNDNLAKIAKYFILSRFNDLHCLDLSSLIWTKIKVSSGVYPTPCDFSTVSYFDNNYLLLFGGSNDSLPEQEFNEVRILFIFTV